MIKFISGIASVCLYPLCKVNYLHVYANKGEKYREYDEFPLFLFPYYRTKVATERLWSNRYVKYPLDFQIHTEEELSKKQNIVISEDDGCPYERARLEISFLDGTKDVLYYDTNLEAEQQMAYINKKYNLKLWQKAVYETTDI